MITPIKNWSEYTQACDWAARDPAEFWAHQARGFFWETPWEEVGPDRFSAQNLDWFTGAELNITVNALDRHAQAHPDTMALMWEPQNADVEPRTFTYQELLNEVEKTTGMLRQIGVKKGDQVCLFLPMIPEVVFAMLACARIGAVHVVVFAGYSAEALAQRIQDTGCTVVITANAAVRGEKSILLKDIVDKALHTCHKVNTCLVVQREKIPTPMQKERDHWWHEKINHLNDKRMNMQPETMFATDPLFILHTSGSTGHPKGVVHSVAGYMVYAAYTFANVFQYKKNEVYWSTADIGWITGHTYGVYGPLLQGATVLMTEGSFLYPNTEHLCQIIEKYHVSILYTAPTVLRTMAQQPEHKYGQYYLSSLRLLGSVGEHLDASTWQWYWRVIGQGKCEVVDTWWQTETGGVLLATLPGVARQKPGVAGLPLPGITPDIDDTTQQLTITQPWPGLALTLYNQKQRFADTYFPNGSLAYHTYDKAKIDADGYVQLLGRDDDVLNVSGHRVACADVERALLNSPFVVEAAVVSRQHAVTGEEICAFVVCPQDQETKTLEKDLNILLATEIGKFIQLGVVHITSELPKTRSGKILRRFLRQLVRGEEIGDISVLANPEGFTLLQQIYKNREE